MYDSAHYAHSRLAGTYIRDENNKVKQYCRAYNSDAGIMLTLSNPVTGEQTHHLMKKCNLKPIPLGYVQVEGVSIFLTRQPMRECWRQGLRQRNARWHSRHCSFEKLMMKVQHCVDNIYPTLSSALQQIVSGGQSVAISRQFSITNEFVLMYKNRPVGDFLVEEGCIQLKQHYIYLTEQLQGAVK